MMRKLTVCIVVLIIIIITLFLISCGGGGGGPSGPVLGNISGYVKELATKKGLDNFTVYIGGRYTKTSNGGYYEMKDVQNGLPIVVTGSIGGQNYKMLAPATVIITNQGGDNPQPTIYMVADPPDKPDFK